MELTWKLNNHGRTRLEMSPRDLFRTENGEHLILKKYVLKELNADQISTIR